MLPELEQAIRSILPWKKDEGIAAIGTVLDDLGIQESRFLGYVDPEDLYSVLPKFEARALSRKMKATFVPCPNRPVDEATVPTLTSSPITEEGSMYSYSMPMGGGSFTDLLNCSLTTGPVVNVPSVSPPVRIPPAEPTVEKPWTDRVDLTIPQHMISKLDTREFVVSERRAIVRYVIDRVHEVEKKPVKKDLAILANRIVAKHPRLIDVDEGVVMGNGFGSLLTQLVNRHDNVCRDQNRKEQRCAKRRKVGTEPATKKLRTLDAFGTINRAPKEFPPGQTAASQEELRQQLAQANQLGNQQECVNLQAATYVAQRKYLNTHPSAEDTLGSWPTLMSFEGMMSHMLELTGQKFLENIYKAYDTKASNWLDFLRAHGNKHVQKLLEEMDAAITRVGDNSPMYGGLFVLMAAHFNEKTHEILKPVKETDGPSAVEGKLPSTPCMVYCGASPMTAVRYMMSADETIINRHVSTFPKALAMMFALHWLLDIKYSAYATATMDAFQRCFVGINPTQGSKSSNKKHADGIHPRVGTFLSKYGHFMATK